jgi:hypothetical protein
MKLTIPRADRTTQPLRTRSRAAVVGLILLGLVQLFVAVAVPFAEARTPSKLGMHIEQKSERSHYVHDEALCSACTARHLTGTAPASPPLAEVALRVVVEPTAAPLIVRQAERSDPLAARAPPAPITLA